MGVLSELPRWVQVIIGLFVVVVVVLIIVFFKRLYDEIIKPLPDSMKNFIDWIINLPKTISNFFKHPFGL